MRPATQEEEEFLEMEECMEEMLVDILVECKLDEDNCRPPWPDVTEEAEAFNQEAELRKWNEAQLQVRAGQELEPRE
ncbi:hypothetical protein CLOM_g16810 [Closterium sp. NIES-68]|nr:hypothetical protein CLOM_g16810 [Closterium sp. NIES-68]